MTHLVAVVIIYVHIYILHTYVRMPMNVCINVDMCVLYVCAFECNLYMHVPTMYLSMNICTYMCTTLHTAQ